MLRLLIGICGLGFIAYMLSGCAALMGMAATVATNQPVAAPSGTYTVCADADCGDSVTIKVE